jgi:hypothetical protein
MGSNDIVFSRVIIDLPFKNVYADLLLIELIAPAQKRLLADELKERA